MAPTSAESSLAEAPELLECRPEPREALGAEDALGLACLPLPRVTTQSADGCEFSKKKLDRLKKNFLGDLEFC